MSNIDFPSSPVNNQPFNDFIYKAARNVWDFDAIEKPFNIEYLVIAGGGSGAARGETVAQGGGGAGGYRTNVVGETSGGGASAEPALTLVPGSYAITIGAGGTGVSSGAGVANGLPGNKGSNSIFHTITSEGGGFGSNLGTTNGGNGGSGGGGAAGSTTNTAGGTGASGQGYAGGAGLMAQGAGGGGGAGAVGVTATTGTAGNGGAGLTSSITGSPVTRAGGGGGTRQGSNTGTSTGGTGGGTGGVWTQTGGGAATSASAAANTGGGSGGARSEVGAGAATSGNGGSGIVILKYPAAMTLTVGPGLTSSTTTSGNFKITSFTAGTDTVRFS